MMPLRLARAAPEDIEETASHLPSCSARAVSAYGIVTVLYPCASIADL